MANYKSRSERYNDRMDSIFEGAKRLERERLERGERPNPNLTSPEDALKYGWKIEGREVTRTPEPATSKFIVNTPTGFFRGRDFYPNDENE